MEPIELFAASVLTVCVIHLATVAGTRLESWWRKTTGYRKPAVTGNRQRSDWYAFFHCADLVGKEPSPRNHTSDSSTKTGVAGKTKAPAGRRTASRLRLS